MGSSGAPDLALFVASACLLFLKIGGRTLNVPSELPRLQSPTTPPPVFDSAIVDNDDGDFISIHFTAIRPYDGGPVQLIIQNFTDFREQPLWVLTDYTMGHKENSYVFKLPKKGYVCFKYLLTTAVNEIITLTSWKNYLSASYKGYCGLDLAITLPPHESLFASKDISASVASPTTTGYPSTTTFSGSVKFMAIVVTSFCVLFIIIVVFNAVLVKFCWRRESNAKDSPKKEPDEFISVAYPQVMAETNKMRSQDSEKDLWSKMEKEHPKAFFIYHTLPNAECAYARRILYHLRDLGINCTSSEFEMVDMAKGITDWLIKKLNEADAILLLCNSHLKSAWERQTPVLHHCDVLIRQAAVILNGWEFGGEKREGNDVIIPILLENSKAQFIPDLYKQRTTIRLPCEEDWERLHRLIMNVENYELNRVGKPVRVPSIDSSEDECMAYVQKIKETNPTLQN